MSTALLPEEYRETRGYAPPTGQTACEIVHRIESKVATIMLQIALKMMLLPVNSWPR
ncbi:Uncharacterised protein [Mycobacteroides abscessus subsp. abscessus]|nr:hypothetical protein MMUC44124_21760 [Mycolicibacterium mucogenicum DSM 44124]SLE97323.1 Uncharacterised protein [Mycobacteroides abscessus subsp. abscessus]